MDRQALHIQEARARVRAARFPNVPLDAAATVVRAATGGRVEQETPFRYLVGGMILGTAELQKLARGTVRDSAAEDRAALLRDLRARVDAGEFAGIAAERLAILEAREQVRAAATFGRADRYAAERVLRAAGVEEPPSRAGYMDRYTAMDIRRMARKIAAPLAEADAAEALAAVRTYIERTESAAPPEAAGVGGYGV
jgi:hypothetical protein